MVKHGLFGLGIVHAETGEIYLEHGVPGRSNDIYAEVEPEGEFYLQLYSDAPEVVYADIRVDGTLIQKGHRVYPGMKSKIGVLRANSTAAECTNTEVALRFARAKVHDDSREKAATYWTGQVEATFYGNPSYHIAPGSVPKPYFRDGPVIPEKRATVAARAVNPMENITVTAPALSGSAAVSYAPRDNLFYSNHGLASSDVGYVPGKSAENQKKGVKSAEGTTALREHNLKWNKPQKPDTPKNPKNTKNASNLSNSDSGPTVKVKEPKNLGSITVRYCSTVGLIHAGILDKPPNWELEVLKKSRSKRAREDDLKVLSKAKLEKIELKSETINGRGEKIVEKREVELYDLTDQ
ncbi:hypothetical protein ACHAWF_018696 [Thalassiosira exigua]